MLRRPGTGEAAVGDQAAIDLLAVDDVDQGLQLNGAAAQERRLVGLELGLDLRVLAAQSLGDKYSHHL